MRERIRRIVQKTIGGGIVPEVSVPEKKEFGHYSTSVALRIAKERQKIPMLVAGELAPQIFEAGKGLFERVEIASPGFINMWISKDALQNEFLGIARAKKSYGKSSVGKKRTVIVEYSQPNIAKQMHVGHLRTTILGDVLANVYDMLGYKVVRWNYLGDWGTQFGKLIAAYKMWGKKAEVQKNPIATLQKLYVRFHDEMKLRPALKKTGQEEFKKLEEGDKENRKLWEWFKKESLKEFNKIYKILDVKFDTWIGESFFESGLKSLVDDLVKKSIAKKSEGAIVIPLDAAGLPPALIQKSDGASLYLTRDIANLRYRIKKYKPEKILYVVGNEQSFHFAQLFAVAKILRLDAPELKHIKYGLVLGEEGKKLATREGRAILLEDVIQKATKLARKVVEEKNKTLSAKEKSAVAEAVAISALKYTILKENAHSDITFNWERMLDFTGESGPYLQYTYTRLMSILRKVKPGKKADVKLLEKDEELALIRKLIEFPDVLVLSAKNYATNHLAAYLYVLANTANQFYESTPVLKDENEARKSAKLMLVETTASVLGRGLELLGIRTLNKI